jgi:hypothetical protein
MNIVLTVNDKNRAMLLHDTPLGFLPSWVEFSHDGRGVRIISLDGQEFTAGVIVKPETWRQLDNANGILLVQMQNQNPIEGYEVPFVNQYYEGLINEAVRGL